MIILLEKWGIGIFKQFIISILFLILLLQGCHYFKDTFDRDSYELRKELEGKNSKYNKPSNDDVNKQDQHRMIEQCDRIKREIRKCENDWSEYESCISNSQTRPSYGNQDKSYLCIRPPYNCNKISKECN